MSAFGRTTLYKAIKRPDGKVVVLDPDYLGQTSQVFADEGSYLIAKGQGWRDSPTEALAVFEAEEAALGQAAAERAYADRNMSDAAQAEAAAVESESSAHLAEIPDGKKPRGRPRKVD